MIVIVEPFLNQQQNTTFTKFRYYMTKIPTITATVVKTCLENNFIHVRIANQNIRSLVDSGSSLCCIRKSLLCKIDTSLTIFGTSEHSHVVGVSGKLIEGKGTVTLTLKIGDQQFCQKFHVFDDIHHSLILGVNFLKNHKCKLNFATSMFES